MGATVPGSREEARGPRRDPRLFYPRDWVRRGVGRVEDHGTGESLLEGGREAGTGYPGEDADSAWMPGRGLCGRGRRARCACAMAALGRGRAGVQRVL